MLEFHGFLRFLSEFSALETYTEMMVQNFMPFGYWKSTKFTEKLENTCVECNIKMNNFVVCHRHTVCV